MDSVADHINLVFIGHVDAGKSTCCGQILLQTKSVDTRSFEKACVDAEKNKMESWKFAYLMDGLDEERERGKTIDMGKAFFTTSKRRYTILDAPGHRTYIHNMILAVTQADIAILIVSARKGEFESGISAQTREHAILCRALGSKYLVVAVNKMDQSGLNNWSEERYNHIVQHMQRFLKSIGYPPQNVKYIPISAYTNQNILTTHDHPLATISLLDLLDSYSFDIDKLRQSKLVVPIVDSYLNILHGKIESGQLNPTGSYRLYPPDQPVELISVSTPFNLEQYGPLENVTIQVKDFAKGQNLVLSDKPLTITHKFRAKVMFFDFEGILTVGSSLMVHLGPFVTDATITKFDIKGPCIKSNSATTLTLESDTPLCVDKEIAKMNRIALRQVDNTIGYGVIIGVAK